MKYKHKWDAKFKVAKSEWTCGWCKKKIKEGYMYTVMTPKQGSRHVVHLGCWVDVVSNKKKKRGKKK